MIGLKYTNDQVADLYASNATISSRYPNGVVMLRVPEAVVLEPWDTRVIDLGVIPDIPRSSRTSVRVFILDSSDSACVRTSQSVQTSPRATVKLEIWNPTGSQVTLPRGSCVALLVELPSDGPQAAPQNATPVQFGSLETPSTDARSLVAGS